MPPKIDDAPGLAWKSRKVGWEARWQARTDLVKRGYSPKSYGVWKGVEPTETERAYIAEVCRMRQDEMLEWSRGGLPGIGEFSGTVDSLICCYQTDEDSPYRTGRHCTRTHYDNLCRTLSNDLGHRQIAELDAREVLRWHAKYLESGRVSSGHALVGMLRTLLTFGKNFLKSKECAELKEVLHDMRFKMAPARSEALTAEQVTLICQEAHRKGRGSVAFAQVLQFGLTIRQKDVIGEWVPLNEKGMSTVIHGNSKWMRGLDWREVNSNFIVDHITSKRGKRLVADLKLEPMIVAELEKLHGLDRSKYPASGPLIISEQTGIAYQAQAFRKLWRRIATAVGIPASVRSMDSRAGGITEMIKAGVSLETARKAATHSSTAMTSRYSRDDVNAVADAMRARAANRNKTGNETA